MLKFLIYNFKKTNECLILAIPLVIFMTITQIYMYSVGNISYSGNEYLFILVTLWVWFSGCCAAWFYMTKKTLDFSYKVFPFEKDRQKALLHLFKCLFRGIGKLFLPMLVVNFFFFVLLVLKFIIEAFLFMLLPVNYLFVLCLDIFLYFIIFYCFIFWIPEIVYCEKNPFKALINSVKNVVKSVRISFGIYAFIFIISSIILFALLYFILNVVIFSIILLLFYYFIIYSVIMIFDYYRGNFVK